MSQPEPTISYVRFGQPVPQAACAGKQSQVLGFYRARFADDLTIAIPHTGVTGTLSARPVDLSDPSEREPIRQAALDAWEMWRERERQC